MANLSQVLTAWGTDSAKSAGVLPAGHDSFTASCLLGAGKTRGALYVLPFQMMVNVGMCVTYDVIAGQALRGVCTSLSGQGGCSVGLSVWIVVFSSAHLALVLLPDISSIAWVNALGALMTVGFSVLATIGAAMAGRHRAWVGLGGLCSGTG